MSRVEVGLHSGDRGGATGSQPLALWLMPTTTTLPPTWTQGGQLVSTEVSISCHRVKGRWSPETQDQPPGSQSNLQEMAWLATSIPLPP